jgi:hypothetical protein
MVKKGQEEVSRADLPLQGLPRDPTAPKTKHRGGSESGRRARGRKEGASKQKSHASRHR